MFTGTLLTVVADAWLRVYKSDPVELGVQSAPPEYASRVLQSEDPAHGWNDWLRQIVRRAVVGGYLDPEAGTRCSDQPDVLSLITEVENRQRRWHEPGNHPFTEPKHFTPRSDGHGGPCNGKELLCLRVVGNARSVIAKFNFEPHEFPQGIVPDGLESEMNCETSS